jgi:hypothetical protein
MAMGIMDGFERNARLGMLPESVVKSRLTI